MFNLDLYTDKVYDICKKYAVKRLEVFGSSLRDDFDETHSDIDLFYEFDGNENLFVRFMGLKRELENVFGRKVDLLKESQIQNPFLKNQIIQSPRKILYAA